MTSGFPELLVSLTVQTTLLLLAARFALTLTSARQSPDRIWPFCHFLILLLSLVGVFFPHVRLFRSELLLDACHRATSVPFLHQFWILVFWIWCCVSVGLTVNMLRSLLQVTFMLRSASRLSLSNQVDVSHAGENLLQVSDSLAVELKTAGVSVLMSKDCLAPFCWQLQRPIIVLPEMIELFPVDEVEAVIRHELAHLQARHSMQLFLQRLVEIGYWFHPLVWKTSGEALMQRELAADRMANVTQAHAVSFVKSLMRLSDAGFGHSIGSSIGLSLFTGGSSLVRRRVDQLVAIDWSQSSTRRPTTSGQPAASVVACMTFTAAVASLVWIPLNPLVTGRTLLSPWPAPTATLLHEAGINVRDYELDSHRIMESLHEGD